MTNINLPISFWQIFCERLRVNKNWLMAKERNKLVNRFFDKMKHNKPSDNTDNDISTDNIPADNIPENQEEEITSAEETETSTVEAEESEIRAESNAEIEALQSELTEVKDKYLRLSAEFDNYRKRTLREKTELIQTAGESLLKDLLPVVDDFERGLEMIGKSDDVESVKTGIDLIYAKLKEFMGANGVKEIEAMNESFDADLHEAVTNIPAPSDDMKGKIVDVIQKGYALNGKIIRYPKVIIGE